eukprot:12727562-Prorocentrum_lima.AAC.1
MSIVDSSCFLSGHQPEDLMRLRELYDAEDVVRRRDMRGEERKEGHAWTPAGLLPAIPGKERR